MECIIHREVAKAVRTSPRKRIKVYYMRIQISIPDQRGVGQ